MHAQYWCLFTLSSISAVTLLSWSWSLESNCKGTPFNGHFYLYSFPFPFLIYYLLVLTFPFSLPLISRFSCDVTSHVTCQQSGQACQQQGFPHPILFGFPSVVVQVCSTYISLLYLPYLIYIFLDSPLLLCSCAVIACLEVALTATLYL